MPEYLAPGVFVEEVSYRAKSIEGVGTTTTGFIGPTRYGPTSVEPELITGMADYERVYGDGSQLVFGNEGAPIHNFMWHAARAFFENGGKRLYVQRVFARNSETKSDGCASWPSEPATPGAPKLTIKSRFPGASSSRRVRITVEVGPNVLSGLPDLTARAPRPVEEETEEAGSPPELASPPEGSPPEGSPPEGAVPVLHTVAHLDVVQLTRPTRTPEFWQAHAIETETGRTWTLKRPSTTLSAGDDELPASSLYVHPDDPTQSDKVQVVTATVTVFPDDPEAGLPQVWGRLPLDAEHRSFGAQDSLSHQFAAQPENLSWRRTVPIVLETDRDGLTVLDAIRIGSGNVGAFNTALANPLEDPDLRSMEVLLKNGDDGDRPGPAEYEGEQRNPDDKTGLKQFEDLEEVSIVAAPGATAGMGETRQRPVSLGIIQCLISHAERMRYRIAVLESGNKQDLTEVSTLRAGLDSKHAALYYPWVRVFDPITKQEISLPPAGFVAGIYARNDTERAVYKAPANEVVTLAIGFERTLNKAQQEVLNPRGVNCFRYFEGRGYRLWGARTISSDPEWKYVNLRRYFAYLERSIDVGTQWAVFEPNGPQLWANVRRTVSDFLFNEFVSGAFLGDRPETSYFVRCDRSTMTQNDIDNGRLVCLVGVAVVKPAEFVIFRIGQWTATRS